MNAQGEDVVAGIRTPSPLNNETKNDRNRKMKSMAEVMPEAYKELVAIRDTLEKHYHDMQDLEFTVENGRLFMLQCRVGKRGGKAAVTMALDMLAEKLIDEPTAVMRVQPNQVIEFLLPIIEPAAEQRSKVLVQGLPAGPGAAFGGIYFSSADAVEAVKLGKKAILVREETNPEDVEGMRSADGILTARGGMTSHAALVARGWGKSCIVGASDMVVDEVNKTVKIGDKILHEGDVITINGSKGFAYEGDLPLVPPTAGADYSKFLKFMNLVDKHRTMGVRANADNPADAQKAREFGAEGIGLFRTEHMFYGTGSAEPLFLLRKMILCVDKKDRIAVLKELFPAMKNDIKQTMKCMGDYPVTVRLLDPPLHEFVPHSKTGRMELSKSLNVAEDEIVKRIDALAESTPLMGHRGVRLSVTYPEITEYQVRAIFEAAAEISVEENRMVVPEIMVPITSDIRELKYVSDIVKNVHAEIKRRFDFKEFNYHLGTMIEIPRAALNADKLAGVAEFFSFGTNDLSQMTFGFSRDDIGAFMGEYLNKHIIDADPFQTIDVDGVGQHIKMAAEKGRSVRPDIHLGICGEQGGDPASVEFCYNAGLTYVSCSPFRVPIARVAAAQAAIRAQKKAAK